jgi:hypothetical protein
MPTTSAGRCHLHCARSLRSGAEPRKLEELEKKYDEQFAVVFEAIKQLMTPPELPPKRRIACLPQAGVRRGRTESCLQSEDKEVMSISELRSGETKIKMS